MLKCTQFDVKFAFVKILSSIFLLQAKNGEAALVDTGTPHSFSEITQFLNKNNVKNNQLKSIFLTHAHLDHSGNVSLFTRKFPNIKIYLNPLTARVMKNPLKICERMKYLMGKRYQKEFYDEVQPINNKFLVETHENMKIKFGDSYLQVINTPGHSPDHISFYELSTKTLFSGDAIGQAYETVTPYRSIVSFPSMCVPQYFNNTLQKIRKLNPKRIAVAHFGFVKNVQNHLDQCEYYNNEYQKILKNPKSSSKRLLQLYDSIFFPGCTKKYHRIRGHYRVNENGIQYLMSPNICVNYYDC